MQLEMDEWNVIEIHRTVMYQVKCRSPIPRAIMQMKLATVIRQQPIVNVQPEEENQINDPIAPAVQPSTSTAAPSPTAGPSPPKKRRKTTNKRKVSDDNEANGPHTEQPQTVDDVETDIQASDRVFEKSTQTEDDLKVTKELKQFETIPQENNGTEIYGDNNKARRFR